MNPRAKTKIVQQTDVVAMKRQNVQCHFLGLNDHRRWREMMRPELARLQGLMLVHSAVVVLEHHWNGGPPFVARVHLAVPGPDIHIEARDHTLQAAWRKVCGSVEKEIERRKSRQTSRVKFKRQQPVCKPRWSRPAFQP